MRRTIALSAGLGLALTGGALAGDAPGMAATPPAPAPPPPASALAVTVAAVARRPLAARVVATGTVTAWREIVVGARAGGLAIVEVLADEGDRVRAGQPLARLDDAVLRAQAAGQDASIAEAEANLAIARAQAAHARDLVPIRAMSREDAETRENAARVAAARLDLARANRAQTEAQLAQALVLAPAAGTVLRRAAVAGSIAAAGAELFHIAQDDRLEVDALVPEASLGRIVPGQVASVTGPDGAAAEARVRIVAPVVDPKTRLGTVRLALPAGTALRPGAFVRAEIRAPGAEALAVPEGAVVWRGGRAGVFRVGADGAVRFAETGAGRRAGGYAEVAGLAEGERVAVKGAGFLADGDRVRLDVAAAGE